MSAADMLKLFSVEFDSGIPAYKQIINQVCALTRGGILKAGDQLPTIHSLKEALGLNPNTVAKAFRELELRGVISSQRGRGSYVAPGYTPAALGEAERRAKLDSLYAKMLADANGLGLSENEVKDYINNK